MYSSGGLDKKERAACLGVGEVLQRRQHLSWIFKDKEYNSLGRKMEHKDTNRGIGQFGGLPAA